MIMCYVCRRVAYIVTICLQAWLLDPLQAQNCPVILTNRFISPYYSPEIQKLTSVLYVQVSSFKLILDTKFVLLRVITFCIQPPSLVTTAIGFLSSYFYLIHVNGSNTAKQDTQNYLLFCYTNHSKL